MMWRSNAQKVIKWIAMDWNEKIHNDAPIGHNKRVGWMICAKMEKIKWNKMTGHKWDGWNE